MDSDNIFERWSLNKIINVSGTMTSLGASRVLPKIRKDVDQILNSFVDIDQLQNEASRVIRKVIGIKDLIGSPHKKSNKENLFDFTKNRVNISLCVSEKFVFKPSMQI